MKKKKRKLTPQEEKDEDYFIDRLLNILMMQVEQKALSASPGVSENGKINEGSSSQ